MTPPSPTPTATPAPTPPPRTALFAVVLVIGVVVLAVFIGLVFRGSYRGPASAYSSASATPASTDVAAPSGASGSPTASSPPTASNPLTASGSAPAQPSTDIPGTEGTYSSDQMWIRSEAARKLWYATATGFAKNYTLASKPRDAAAWRAALAPYSSAKVNAVLARRTLDQVPVKAAWDGYLEVVDYKPTQIAITVNYDDGYALVLYIEVLEQPTQLARVAAFDRLDQ